MALRSGRPNRRGGLRTAHTPTMYRTHVAIRAVLEAQFEAQRDQRIRRVQILRHDVEIVDDRSPSRWPPRQIDVGIVDVEIMDACGARPIDDQKTRLIGL